MRKPDYTPDDNKYARSAYKRLKGECGRLMTTCQVAREMNKDTYQASQYLNNHDVKQAEPGYYRLDDVVPCLTLWHHNEIKKQMRKAKMKALQEA